MYIMTETGYRPLHDFSDYWTTKNEAVEKALEDVAAVREHFNPFETGLDDMTYAGRNRVCNLAYNRLFAARDAQLGHAPTPRRNFITTL